MTAVGPASSTRPSTAAVAAAVVCALTICTHALFAQAQATYLYNLADFGGPLAYDNVRISVDREANETYALYQNIVHIFNASGMEVFRFGEDLDLGQVLDVAVDEGDILLLSLKDSRTIVTRCNFRGVPTGTVEPNHLPAGLTFRADRLAYRHGQLYFVSLPEASVIVTGIDGEFTSHVDFLSLLPSDQRKDGVQAFGFAVDDEGSMFFTMPTLFKVFKRAKDGTLTSFGKAGATPGLFGIASGIASDSQGNLFVTDKLRCVVMVFDKDFNFITEFGHRGTGAENLIIPVDVVTDAAGRIYVSQYARRGVSVFSFTPR